jgi:2,3-bisphosphoglycerate-independent phosphoglycerate mutase
MKFVYLIADGMSGWPGEMAGGRTALEAAHTPTLDALARTALTGQCRTVPQGMPPGSDVANMALLGFAPERYHTGRGPIEAAAQGLDLDADDLVWRMNLVTVSAYAPEGRMEDYSAGHIDTPTAAALIERLQQSLPDGLEIFCGVQYRHLLVERNAGHGPSARIHVRPPHDILGESIGPDLDALAAAPALASFVRNAHSLLSHGNPSRANAIWPWGQGRPLQLPAFEASFGLRGAVISAVDLVRGLGRAAGMEVLEVPGATGLIDTNYEGKVAAALDFLQRGDFAYLHVEAPDECGHMGDAALKTEAIARFDARIVAPMLEGLRALGEPFVLVVTCDHATPVAERTHVADPVPFLVYQSEHAAHGPEVFTEASTRSGVQISSGPELLQLVLARGRG